MGGVGERPWNALLLYALVTAAVYGLACRWPFFTPRVIEPSAFDARLPLVPAAVVPYLSYFFLLPVLIAWTRWRAAFSRVLAPALLCGLVNAAFYLALPTRLALRPGVLPATTAGSLLALLQRADTPLCALPSGHVSLPAAIAVAALLASRSAGTAAAAWRRTSAAFVAWTFVLAASALLIRQHYAIDLAAGIALGVTVAMVAGLATTAANVGAVDTEAEATASAVETGEPPRRAGRRRRVALHRPSVVALLAEWTVIVAAAAVALAWWSWPAALLAGAVIATRQHALLVLYHDAVHGLIARPRRLNDLLINATVGVPLLLPVHLYRALHVSHHRHLGSERDPERVLLYRGQRWSYRPLGTGALALQLAGDLLGWNACVLSWRYFVERRRGGGLRLPRTRFHPELVAQYALFAAAWGAAATAAPTFALRLALLWFLPYVTLTQLLQKLRSFAEHTDDEEAALRSCSWAPGILGRLTLWPYNINYHREHHARPDLAWDRLPAAFPEARQRPGGELRSHVWSGASR